MSAGKRACHRLVGALCALLSASSSLAFADAHSSASGVIVASETQADIGFVFLTVGINRSAKETTVDLLDVHFLRAAMASVEGAIREPAIENADVVRVRGISASGRIYELPGYGTVCVQDQCSQSRHIAMPPAPSNPDSRPAYEQIDFKGIPMLTDTTAIQVMVGPDVVLELPRSPTAPHLDFSYVPPFCKLAHQQRRPANAPGELAWTTPVRQPKSARCWLSKRVIGARGSSHRDAYLKPMTFQLSALSLEIDMELEYTDLFRSVAVTLRVDPAAISCK